MKLTPDSINEAIPAYLTADMKIGIIKALKDFPNISFPTTHYPNEILQGDVWSSFQIFRFADGVRDSITGIVLSNTCDIDPKNVRSNPSNISFAPLVSVSKYEEFLRSKKIDDSRITRHVASIKAQEVSNMFYLPSCSAEFPEEQIVFFDRVQSMPYLAFERDNLRRKSLTLSQVAFYLFLMKLSIHFCRFHENVIRDLPEPTVVPAES